MVSHVVASKWKLGSFDATAGVARASGDALKVASGGVGGGVSDHDESHFMDGHDR